MTKPVRNRPAQPSRKAPTYPRLPRDRYAALNPEEQRRHDAHVDIDAIHDAIVYAELDRRSHGWPSNRRLTDTSPSTDEGALNPVESWSQQPDPASDWLAAYAEMRGHIIHVANQARYHFGFDPERGRPELARPKRRNDVELCVWCDQPAPAGRDNEGRVTVRRVDGRPVHATPCYWAASHEARQTGRSVADIITAKKAS
jgi:hypothetical protein